MSIDPNNLGPKVYKEDQVITREDLAMLRLYFYTQEVEAVSDGDISRAAGACNGHRALEEVLVWLNEGKPSLVEKEEGDG